MKKEDQEKLKELDIKLAKQREKWTKDIKNLSENLKYVDSLQDTISQMLSSRQKLIDQIAYYNQKYKHQKRNIDEQYKNAYMSYQKSENKINKTQIDNMINSDLSYEKCVLSYLENQIDFLKESVKTLDNMGHAVRNRLQLQNL
jgi:hypothetical protein